MSEDADEKRESHTEFKGNYADYSIGNAMEGLIPKEMGIIVLLSWGYPIYNHGDEKIPS